MLLIPLECERPIKHCIAVEATMGAGVIGPDITTVVATALAAIAADLHFARLVWKEAI